MKYVKKQLIYGPEPEDKIVLAPPYKVLSITGLEAPEIAVNVSERIFEGGNYLGSRPENKEIVITMALLPDYSIDQTVEALRTKLNDLLDPLSDTLTFELLTEDESEKVHIQCRVKRIESPIYTKDPIAQITLTCFSPFLEADEYVASNLSFLNSQINVSEKIIINNPGSAPTGFKIVLEHFGPAANEFQMILNNKRFCVDRRVEHGHIFTVDTRAGSRKAELSTMFTDGINVLDDLAEDSEWIQLRRGSNHIHFESDDLTITEFRFTPRYWGL